MIQIQRGKCPSILKRPNLLASYYNHQDVTNALRIMQFGKCAYCEAMIIDSPQIDHYNPKEEYIIAVTTVGKKQYDWHKANQWKNLLYACSKCNGAKKKEKPFENNTRVIINPRYLKIDPEDHIDFHIIDKNLATIKVFVTTKDGSPLGNSTIRKLKLHIRKDHLGPLSVLAIEFENLFLKLLVHIRNQRDIYHADCQTQIAFINRYMLSNSAYSGFARAFFRKRLDEFEKNERQTLETKLGHEIDLMITIATGIRI